ncbi:N-6 DNA methylase [Oceanobacillus kapialis]|uniref:N-6 DNA methylase n=1 Tax=Oceanobacillus kapialis TaxID=481353 RepID=UPI00385182C0
MTIGHTQENERSWAIDLISQINNLVSMVREESIVQRAGGEMSLSTGGGSLFPDVLLFGDSSKTKVLQGWELKYPDTSIDDRDLFSNAVLKADLLGVNSFLLWNVTIARLYVRDEDTNNFVILKEWDDLKHITKRNEVAYCMAEINKVLNRIIDDLNYYFRNNKLRAEKVFNSIVSDNILTFAFRNIEMCAQSFEQVAIKNSDFNDNVLLWWEAESISYGNRAEKWVELSKLAIVSFMNKLIFANILKKFKSEALIVNEVSRAESVAECLDIFISISESCDFYNIFEEKLGERYIDNNTLDVLLSFNNYLMELDFTNYSNELLEELLTQVVIRSKRKVSGQFTTPKELAMILTALTTTDKSSRILDPCCGTGTIVKTAYDFKTLSGIESPSAIDQVWAGDKFRYPLQFAMLALSSPENIGEQINIFKEDVFNLNPQQIVKLHSPNKSETIDIELGKFDVVLSNLPFVQQETFGELNSEAIKFIGNMDEKFNGRSDLYTYIALKLDSLLTDNGAVGLIISNSWLGTEFGEKFFNELRRKYSIKYIVTSANGRWFKNAEVVTNMVVLHKGNDLPSDNSVKFISLNEKVEDIVGNSGKAEQFDNVSRLVAKVRRGIDSELFNSQEYKYSEIEQLSDMGVIKNALFADCKWLFKFENRLVPLTDYFKVKRGERRGWNRLFYPRNHNIESDYIVPVMKRLDTSSYLMNLDSSIDGFCCSKTIEELECLEHDGAIDWIHSFETVKNGKGILLKEGLKSKNLHWYEMSLKSKFDLGLLINPDERLFFSKAPKPVFFDQRLTGLVRHNDNDDLTLLSALLNSIVGVFYIEAIGFGRGLGALDLNKNKVEAQFKILNAKLVSEDNKKEIIQLYAKLEERDVKPLLMELQQIDRYEFDIAVLKAFGVEEYYGKIKESLLQLFNIRKSVRW